MSDLKTLNMTHMESAKNNDINGNKTSYDFPSSFMLVTKQFSAVGIYNLKLFALMLIALKESTSEMFY